MKRAQITSLLFAALAVGLALVWGRRESGTRVQPAAPSRLTSCVSAPTADPARAGARTPAQAVAPEVSLGDVVRGVDGGPVEGVELVLMEEPTGGVFAGLACAGAGGEEGGATTGREAFERCGCEASAELVDFLARAPTRTPVAVTRTGPGGVFSFTLDGGDARYTLSGEWADEELRVDLLTPPEPELKLSARPKRPRSEVLGDVVDEAGRGVAGAPVLLVSEGGAVAQRTVTDARGHFAFKGVSEVELVLAAVTGLPPATERLVLDGQPVTLHLARRTRVEGRVTRGGTPAAGVAVSVDEPCTAPVVSDGLGRFAFELPVGEFSLSATEGRRRGGALVHIEAGQPPAAVVVELLMPGRLEGQIVDSLGRPVPGAQVSWHVPSLGTMRVVCGLRASPRLEADDAGRFALEGDPGGDYEVTVFAPGRQPVTREVQWAAGEVRRERFVLHAGALLSGVVVDGEGRPVEGADVEAQACEVGGSCDDLFLAITRRDGTFSSTTLPEGPARLVVSHADFRAQAVQAVLPERGLRVVLRPVLRLRGTVLDAQGVPAPGALVLLDSLSEARVSRRAVEAGAQGAFEFDLHREDRFRLIATERGGGGRTLSSGTTELELTAHEPGPVMLRLSPGAALSGQVVDASGRGVEGALVVAEPDDTGDGPAPASVRQRRMSESAHPGLAVSGPGGDFVLRGLVTGEHQVWAEVPGELESEPVRAPAGTQGLSLQLSAKRRR